MREYQADLLKQRQSIISNKGLCSYFEFLYSLVSSELGDLEAILEVGAGAGISNLFLKNRILRTDFLAFPKFAVTGDCPMEQLPFSDASFEVVLAIDCIHHSTHPLKALAEFLRVLDNGGKIIIIEPYVSLLSYLPYRLFHHEKTNWNFKGNLFGEVALIVQNPAIGNQGVSRFLIECLQHKAHELLPNIKTRIHYFSAISFFATGGVSRSFCTPPYIIKSIIAWETRFSQSIMKFLASRVLIVIEK